MPIKNCYRIETDIHTLIDGFELANDVETDFWELIFEQMQK